jgi:diguanylate cyclase (GGDEF)-like protein
MNLSKHSLLIILGVIIILVVAIVMSMHSTHLYVKTKQNMLQEMKYDSNYLGSALQKNLSTLISSYSVNEYEQLILNSIQHRNNFAIIVEDFNMGKIIGKQAYMSGAIRDDDWSIIAYEHDKHKQQLESSFYVNKFDVIAPAGNKVGNIAIYLSNHSLNEELNLIIRDSIYNFLFLSGVLILLLFTIIRFFILKPLTNIITSISHSDETGLPIDTIPDDGSYEIVTLAGLMNRMVNSIRTSNKQLKQQHQELLEQRKTLHYQANYDSLTGLANRYLFEDRLEQSLVKCKRNGSTMALLFIDIDHFKEINDSYGHKVGDKVLTIVAKRLHETIRNNDTLARFGGDEFTIVLDDLVQGEDASILANKILLVIGEPIHLKNNIFYIGSSIGISLYPNENDLSEDLLKNADAAMYKAKSKGRNNFQYYNAEMTRLALDRVLMEANLREAIVNEEFIVYYQPQINGKNDKLIGAEALVRWQSPSMGLVSPAKFIPLAESTGLIVELDRLVMKSAMTQFSQWYQQGFNPGILSMNLAVKQLQQKDFVNVLANLIKQTACKINWIELEVTEGQIMTNPKEAIIILQKIADLGVELAIDDFGTGYSSLSYLKKLPISKLKIDQSFVRGLPEDAEDTSIAKAVILLAQSLNLKIIAEGVETIEQKEFLVNNGCANIQGYFYSKPLPADEMKDYLKKNQLQ